eukprot:9638442-Ditylum_brightwellii.AAC.1
MDKTVRKLHCNGAQLPQGQDAYCPQRLPPPTLIKLNIHNGSNHLSHLSSARCGSGTAESAGPSCSLCQMPKAGGVAHDNPVNILVHT